jgi:hypothetical protein
MTSRYASGGCLLPFTRKRCVYWIADPFIIRITDPNIRTADPFIKVLHEGRRKKITATPSQSRVTSLPSTGPMYRCAAQAEGTARIDMTGGRRSLPPFRQGATY